MPSAVLFKRVNKYLTIMFTFFFTQKYMHAYLQITYLGIIIRLYIYTQSYVHNTPLIDIYIVCNNSHRNYKYFSQKGNQIVKRLFIRILHQLDILDLLGRILQYLGVDFSLPDSFLLFHQYFLFLIYTKDSPSRPHQTLFHNL